jgi:hypothetical protein
MIEKNIAMPVRPARKSKPDGFENVPKEVLLKMDIGDSVFIKGAIGQKDSRVEHARLTLRRDGKKCVMRTTPEGVRIWRSA